ncbi:MAG: agmatine deiminase family protein [Proteobacteria bacterium]|nr:agmatine deiminase family protein [Pseudomonadota bacterium]
MTEPLGRGPGAARGHRRRWPAEWEEHQATWLAWPHNPETWPGRLTAVEAAFAAMVEALAPRETVCIAVDGDPMQERARRRLEERGIDPDRGVRFVDIPTDDAWIRDSGPVFVADGDETALLDFRFDSWGGKYPPWERDDAVPRGVAAHLGLRRIEVLAVLEAGSIDGDGRGAVLTTETCLLHPNRGAGRTREELEALLAETLGARHVLWLGGGIAGDDTDGHVDNVARFVAPGAVVAAVENDPGDPNHAPLRDNLERLRAMRDADGKPLDVVPLPMPPSLTADGQRLPASYANFYLANGVALVPVFAAPQDERALAVLRECLPDREIVPIPSADLVVGLGAVHCLTQQQPRLRGACKEADSQS